MKKKIVAKIQGERSEELIKKKKSDLVDTIKLPTKNREHDSPPLLTLSIDKYLLVIIGISTLVFYFRDKLAEPIGIVIGAFIFASAVKPLVDGLVRKGVHKLLAIGIVYILAIILLTGSVVVIVIPLINEISRLVSDYSSITKAIDQISKSIPYLNIDSSLINSYIKDNLSSLSKNITPTLSVGFQGLASLLTVISSIFGGVLNIITGTFISIYLLLELDTVLETILIRFVPQDERDYYRNLLLNVQNKLGSWVLGQLTLSITIGLLSWLGLTILGVPFALPLAVLAGILESIPNLGPILAGIPAAFIGAIYGGPIHFLLVGLIYFIIQQLENTIIVPRVMQNAVGIKALYILLGVLFGYSLAGIVGALIAVPFLAITKIIIEFYTELRKKRIERSLN